MRKQLGIMGNIPYRFDIETLLPDVANTREIEKLLHEIQNETIDENANLDTRTLTRWARANRNSANTMINALRECQSAAYMARNLWRLAVLYEVLTENGQFSIINPNPRVEGQTVIKSDLTPHEIYKEFSGYEPEQWATYSIRTFRLHLAYNYSWIAFQAQYYIVYPHGENTITENSIKG